MQVRVCSAYCVIRSDRACINNPT